VARAVTDPTTVLRLWRDQAAQRKQVLLESLARGMPERDYLKTCGAIAELDFQYGYMQSLITGKNKEVENAED
jgi:hypothetical protein